MRMILTPDEMRALEAEAFNRGLKPIDAMERAASSVAAYLRERLGQRALVYFVCGPGNNGGDGYAAARLYAEGGGRAVVIALGDEERLRGDARENCLRAHETPRVWFRDRMNPGERPDAWVDAMFGIGLKRPAEEACAKMIDRMEADRRLGSLIVAVDMPSGLDGATGSPLGAAVRADVTITFQYAKVGQMLSSGPEYTGELIVKPIGLALNGPEADWARLIEKEDLAGALPRRMRESHKNTYGHLILIAGSMGMAGAAIIAARAALRSGVGLVTVACPASVAPILQSAVPGALCAPLAEADGAIGADALAALDKILEGKSAVALGPGLSLRAHPDVVRIVLSSGLPAVIDADALTILSQNPPLYSLLRAHHVLTPHPGEAARLLNGNPGDALSGAKALRALGATAVVKGPTSVICGARTYLSASGSPGMARGGSGDVLTGMLGALLAQGLLPEKAAWVADELHGLAGELAVARFGEISMTTEDMINLLPEVFRLVF